MYIQCFERNPNMFKMVSVLGLTLTTGLLSTVALAQPGPDPQTAYVFDPVSNVRSTPTDKDETNILCRVETKQGISVFPSGQQGEWYETDYCGETGWIHKSQIDTDFAKYVDLPVLDAKQMTYIEYGPINIHTSPDGSVDCQVKDDHFIYNPRIKDGDWYTTEYCDRPGWVHKNDLKTGETGGIYKQAFVFDPVSNVRTSPDSQNDSNIQCKVRAVSDITVRQDTRSGEWYETDFCAQGQDGWIHSSQFNWK